MKRNLINKYLHNSSFSIEADESDIEETQDETNTTEEESFGSTSPEGGEDPTSGTDDDTSSDSEDDSLDDSTEEENPEEERRKNREIIEERRRAEAEEKTPEEVRVPEIQSEEDEKTNIVKYLEPLLGDTVNDLYLVPAQDLNRPLYHISMNPNIKQFTPQVSKRTLDRENRSLPRISTSTSLIGCMNGYQSILPDMEKRSNNNFTGLYTIYELPFQYAIKPTKRVLPDVNISDEYWLFSWKRETYSVEPNIAAEFTVPKIETTFGNDGTDYVYHLYIHVKGSKLYLDQSHVLQQGYYHVTLKGYDSKFPLDKNDKQLQIQVLDERQYKQVTTLSMMIKKRPSSEYK